MKSGMMGVDISTGSREGEILNNDFSDVVAGAKIIGNRGAYNQDIYFHNNNSHDNAKTAYHDDVSGETYDDGGRGLERQFAGSGIHIYDNVLKGYDKKHDMLYFSGASKSQDDVYGNNEVKNPIVTSKPKVEEKQTPTPKPILKPEIVKQDNSTVTLEIKGKIKEGDHIQFFIDRDLNTKSGFSNGTIKGADFVIEDDHLMKSTESSTSWKWKVIATNLKVSKSANGASVKIPKKIFNQITDGAMEVKIMSSTINKRWQRKSRKYFGIEIYDAHVKNSSENVVKPEPKPVVKRPEPKQKSATNTKAYIPNLDFSKTDVYGNNQVVYVQNNLELQKAVNSAKPNTTIILKDGKYRDLHVVFARGKHHLTIKAENRHQAVITPRGKDDDAAFYLSAGKSEKQINHHINFVDLEVSGGGQFVRSPDASFLNAHHLYFLGVKMQGLWMGLYSGLSSHDWTVDGCEFYNSKASYMWYMMGYHHAVINSVMYNNSYYSIAIRGCYPTDEKFYYYDTEKNRRISERSGHFLSLDDWTHLIANNTFGSNYNNNRLQDAHLSLYYNADEGRKISEDVYFPPKNVMIMNNAFIDSGNGNKKMLNLMAERGVNSSGAASVNGLFIKNNYIDKKELIEADTDISTVDLSSNHTGVSEEEFGFDDTNRDYTISNDSILKDAGAGAYKAK
jgi:hypothetical protein